MSDDKTEVPLQTAGAVEIQSLVIISKTLEFLDISDYLVEMNIVEDIYSPTMNGQIVITDSRNLIKELDITGEEYLIVKFKTPTFNSFISKTFRIYAVTNRRIIRDLSTQTYILHFVSKEFIINQVKPLYRTFTGKVSDLVSKIFESFIQADITYSINDNKLESSKELSKLKILSETENNVKFVSPGWTPFKCINWCASKAIPKDGKACNFLFFETNKEFIFTSVEHLFDVNNNSGDVSIGEYFYSPNQIEGNQSISKKLFQVEEFDVIKTQDHLSNLDNGYLSSKLLTLDIINKIYEDHNYDIVEKFPQYQHSQGKNSKPFFGEECVRNPLTDINFHPTMPGLFNDITDNVNERMFEIHGNRKSNLLELHNFKLNITIPGRTDVQVGRMINFNFPDISPRNSDDKAMLSKDELYSGFYLITSINHKVTIDRHTMVMEITRDSLGNNENI